MVEFVVPGRPKPKARPRFTKNGHRTYTPLQTKDYERKVAWCAIGALKGKCFFNDIGLEIHLYFRGRKTPDIDNCAKAIMDGLMGTAFEDDKQVAHLSVTRHQDANERAEVRIWEIGDAAG